MHPDFDWCATCTPAFVIDFPDWKRNSCMQVKIKIKLQILPKKLKTVFLDFKER
jgi:hypothetical protein